MAKLFEPLKLRSLEVRNRIFVSPMCQYSCENRDGIVGDWHLVHYVSRAHGGAGMIVVEATAVSAYGRITPWCTGIWNEDQVQAWQKVTHAIRAAGSTSAIQLAHAGRKASTYRAWSGENSVAVADGGWQTISATDQPFTGYAAPHKLTSSEIHGVIESWKQGAQNAIRAGFDALEIQ